MNSDGLPVVTSLTCGLLAILGAAGLRRTLEPGPASMWGPRLFGLGGLALVVAGVFPNAPGDGLDHRRTGGDPVRQRCFVCRGRLPLGAGRPDFRRRVDQLDLLEA